MRQRLDKAVTERRLTSTRSQAESYIKLGLVEVNGIVVDQPSHMVIKEDQIRVISKLQYVSRAGLKLKSVSEKLGLNFIGSTVLDVGSSTGGFTDYALKHGALNVIAVEIGADQMHPTLRADQRVELHEKTDIREIKKPDRHIDLVVIDVSFVSLRDILPSVTKLIDLDTKIVAMFKPQFETSANFRHKGVIKNDKLRRQLLVDFEDWLRNNRLVVLDKADSSVHGSKGNLERFYLLRLES